MAEISPITPSRSGHRRIDGVGNRPPLSAITALQSGERRGADLPRPPHRPTEIAGTPSRLTGPFRTDRAAKHDFIPPLILTDSPGHRIRGDGARNRGPPSPSSSGREGGRRGPGPSGEVGSSHSSSRAIRPSRIVHRQFTVPYFRTLIAAEGTNPPFVRRPIAGPAASLKSRKQYRLDWGPKRGSSPGPDGPWF